MSLTAGCLQRLWPSCQARSQKGTAWSSEQWQVEMENRGDIPAPGEPQSLWLALMSYHAEVPKGKHTNTEAMSLYVSSCWPLTYKAPFLTADYTRLILSSWFERTIITPCLILPLNILCQTGRLWLWAVQGGSRHAQCKNKLQKGKDGCCILMDGLWPQRGLQDIQELHQYSPGIHIYPGFSSFKASP